MSYRMLTRLHPIPIRCAKPARMCPSGPNASLLRHGLPQQRHHHRSIAGRAQETESPPALEGSNDAIQDTDDDHVAEISHASHVEIVPDFFDSADALRATFDKNFENPRTVHMDRFCWDYWHVPGQYTQLRTPAQDYFSPEDFSSLESALLEFGTTKLGCSGITPIWLSYYIEGCKQELHCDNPHGPWAFVLSLTDWEARKFSGGETMILTDYVLNFWSNFASDTVIEGKELMRLIEPKFNQLTVFDPRLPHGVRPVHGVHEPTEARIVLHGWFTEPELFLEGTLTQEQAEEGFTACMEKLCLHLAGLPEATGTLVVRIIVDEAGKVADLEFLTDTVVARPWDVRENDAVTARAHIQLAVQKYFSEHTYASSEGSTTITFPIIFD